MDHKDPVSGKSSIETHTPKVVKVWCAPKDHYFEDQQGSKRIAICKECGYEINYVLGLQKIERGKLLDLKM